METAFTSCKRCSFAGALLVPGIGSVSQVSADVSYSKELTNRDQPEFAGIVVMRRTAILKHKQKGHFNLNTQAN